jgi:hypothetical protein
MISKTCVFKGKRPTMGKNNHDSKGFLTVFTSSST